MATDLLKSRAFVRSERALEGYAWVVMGSLLEFAGAEAGGSPIVLVQQYGLFELGSDMELFCHRILFSAEKMPVQVPKTVLRP